MPTVSIIIPAYNAEQTIRETITSVQEQTFSDFEIIIINDGSTDKTLEIIQNITDSRIQCFSYQNSGVAVARNRGLFHAKGEFIAFLDADDLWTTDKLELQVKALQNNSEAGVAYSWTYFSHQDETQSYTDTSCLFEGNVYADLLIKNFLHSGSNPLVRKEAIDKVGLFDMILVPCEDWDYYIRLASIYPFVLIPKAQVIYRQSLGSGSSQIDKVEKSILSVIDRAFQAASSEYQFLKYQSLAWSYKYLVQQYLKYENNFYTLKLATKNVLKVICIQPSVVVESYTQGLIRRLIKQWILMCMPIPFKL